MERQPSKDPSGGGGGPGSVKNRTRAYEAAMEAVLAIPIAMGLGWWADRKLGSAPFGLLIGLLFGFATFVVRLVRMRGMVEAEAAAAERRKEGE